MSAISDAADRAERGNWGPGDPYQNDDNCKQEDADLRVLIDAAREHESLTAQLLAAQATIAAIRTEYEDNDNWSQAGFQYRLDDLLEADTSAHDAAILAAKAGALREAAKTFHDRLPDGTGNGRAYNSYRVAEILRERAASIEQTEANRG